LIQLLLQDSNLLLRTQDTRLCLLTARQCLLFASGDLFVLDCCKHLAVMHDVALSDSDLANPTRGFRGDGGVITFDATTN
jgi:hypothetical protein